MIENRAFDSAAAAAALRTWADLKKAGERGRALMKLLADGGRAAAFALGAEGERIKKRAKEAGRLSHTLDFLNAEDTLDLEGRIEAVLLRFTEGLDSSMRGDHEIRWFYFE